MVQMDHGPQGDDKRRHALLCLVRHSSLLRRRIWRLGWHRAVSRPDTGEGVGEETAPDSWFPTSLLVFVLYEPFGLDNVEIFSVRISERPSKSETSSVSPNESNHLDGDAILNPSSMEKLGAKRKRPTGRAELRETALGPSRRVGEKDCDSLAKRLCLQPQPQHLQSLLPYPKSSLIAGDVVNSQAMWSFVRLRTKEFENAKMRGKLVQLNETWVSLSKSST
ncbi:unnamed protein product [Discosporangium mesarthrocarpum]